MRRHGRGRGLPVGLRSRRPSSPTDARKKCPDGLGNALARPRRLLMSASSAHICYSGASSIVLQSCDAHDFIFWFELSLVVCL
jgi:hypothetical protein